ncbi:type II toxin-antitoxin system RelE family toxin [Dyadobacter sp.]|uniref:type II toxin-antitoxin system RelE family toxin n=1 Tax=Dyadobacter sp. TaxID=1914288 RepID=UPI003F71C9A4
MEVIYKKKFLKDLQSLPPKTQLAVKEILDKLRQAPDLQAAGVDYAPMEGQRAGQNYYRIRVGSYRLGIEYVRPNVLVILIASRGSIYKYFPPK